MTPAPRAARVTAARGGTRGCLRGDMMTPLLPGLEAVGHVCGQAAGRTHLCGGGRVCQTPCLRMCSMPMPVSLRTAARPTRLPNPPVSVRRHHGPQGAPERGRDCGAAGACAGGGAHPERGVHGEAVGGGGWGEGALPERWVDEWEGRVAAWRRNSWWCRGKVSARARANVMQLCKAARGM